MDFLIREIYICLFPVSYYIFNLFYNQENKNNELIIRMKKYNRWEFLADFIMYTFLSQTLKLIRVNIALVEPMMLQVSLVKSHTYFDNEDTPRGHQGQIIENPQ